MALKVVFTTSSKIPCISLLLTFASVVIKQSIVAIAGFIIPAPFAIAPILKLLPSSKTTLNAISFAKPSVVIIAFEADTESLLLKSKSFIPSIIFAFGSLTPITPVELIIGFFTPAGQFESTSLISSTPA